MTKRLSKATVGIVLGMLGVLGLAAPSALAADEPVDERIVAVMEAYPGGVLLDSHHAVWPELGMEMTVPGGFATLAVGNCPTSRICVFDGYNTGGARLSWTSCGTFPISAFTVRSIADARPTGYAEARNGTTVVAYANAGASANVYSTVTNVRCVF